jgi:SAM-dependent methyltransferase
MVRRIRNIVRGLLQVHGPQSIKKRLWDSEFARGSWQCLDTSAGDYVYPFVERFAHGGSVLDLGCGSGSTGVELDVNDYGTYTGVDISEVAVGKARERAEASGRGKKNQYLQSDILTFDPPGKYDVILFRDSLYYIAPEKMVKMLVRYSSHLNSNGVFVARLFDVRGKHSAIVDMIEAGFDVVEKQIYEAQTSKSR